MSDYKSMQSQNQQPESPFDARNERGIAMLTVMMVLILLTTIGIAATTLSGLENNLSGFQRTMETAGQMAESCLGTGANVILQVLLPENGGAVPNTVLDKNGGPVLSGFSNTKYQNNPTGLANEVTGSNDNFPDLAAGDLPVDASGKQIAGFSVAPNLQIPAQYTGAYTVYGDIDRLYVKSRAGSGQQQNAAYDGAGVGVGSNGLDVYYRITCIATNGTTGTESRVSAIYACAFTGDGCQKQP